MKKKVLAIISVLIIIIIGLSILLIIKNNKIIKDESIINVSDNLTIEYGSIAYISDFVSIENAELVDEKISYDKLGLNEIKYYYNNEYGYKLSGTIQINVVDTSDPVVLIGGSVTLEKGYEEEVAKSVICADNYDKTPNCVVEGSYDVNKVGTYPLTYIATDESNNETRAKFNLNIVEKKSVGSSSNSKTMFTEVIEDYKNENTKIGIDVSKWQGDIDWQKVVDAGVEFVIMRVGVQDGFDGEYYVDRKFENNIKGASKQGIDIGLYFYSYATTDEEAKKQANWIIEQVGDYKISLPIVFDWESWSYFNDLSLSLYDITKVQETFLNTIEELGYKGARYGSKYYLTNMWLESDYPTWLAHYTKKTNYDGEYFMWQMCSDGIIDGIDGYVDIDVMYVNQ